MINNKENLKEEKEKIKQMLEDLKQDLMRQHRDRPQEARADIYRLKSYEHLSERNDKGALNEKEKSFVYNEYEKTKAKKLKDDFTRNTESMLYALLEKYPNDDRYDMLYVKSRREGLTTQEMYDIKKEYENKILMPKLYNETLSLLHNVLDSNPDETAALKAKAVILRDFFGKKEKAEELENKVKKLEKKNDAGPLRVVTPRFCLNDIVLSTQNKKQIEQAIAEIQNKKLIYEQWGFGSTLKNSKGTAMLFIGGPGTGKTMTAEALAKHLGKKLLVVNYAQMLCTKVGDTEKQIEACFKEAKEKDAVLFFDEADSLLVSRDDWHTVFWYIDQVNVLLKEVENFEGVIILATNLSSKLDPALERRMGIVIKFDFPDAEMREQIYRKMMPENAPVAKNVIFKELAKSYPLAGGSILNVVKSAVRSAALRHDEGLKDKIMMKDFEYAAKGECGRSKVLEENHLRKKKKEENKEDVMYR